VRTRRRGGTRAKIEHRIRRSEGSEGRKSKKKYKQLTPDQSGKLVLAPTKFAKTLWEGGGRESPMTWCKMRREWDWNFVNKKGKVKENK